MYEIRRNVRRKIEFILIVLNIEMQSLSVILVMLNTEVGIDCSVTHRLYMKVSDMDVIYVNIYLLRRVTSPLTYIFCT